MISLLLSIALSQGPGYSTSEMSFMRDDIGQLWAKHVTDKEWYPVRGFAPNGIAVPGAYTNGETVTLPAIRSGSESGTGRGDGTGGGKPKAAVSMPAVTKAVATTAKPATPEATIKKLADIPKPPNNANGKDRFDYTNRKMDSIESEVSNLRNEVVSLREALQGIVKILERQTATP